MEVLAFSVAISHENEEIRQSLFLISLQNLICKGFSGC